MKIFNWQFSICNSLAAAARVVVAGLFILTGVAKLMGIERFVDEVRKYDMLPVAMANLVAYILPWLELVAGLLLILCVWRREARWVIGGMLAVFTLAKIYAYARGLRIECGCGGQIAFLKYIFALPQGILTNVALLGMLAVDGWAQRRLDAPALSVERPASSVEGQPSTLVSRPSTHPSAVAPSSMRSCSS